MGALSELGLYRLCIENTNADVIFDVGRVAVSQVFWKSVLEFLGTHRFFMFPCSTKRDPAGSENTWAADRVWLPDGMGAWTASIGVTNTDLKETPYLLAGSEASSKFVDFFGHVRIRNAPRTTTATQRALLQDARRHVWSHSSASRSDRRSNRCWSGGLVLV